MSRKLGLLFILCAAVGVVISVVSNQPEDDSPESKHVAININFIVDVLTDDIL